MRSLRSLGGKVLAGMATALGTTIVGLLVAQWKTGAPLRWFPVVPIWALWVLGTVIVVVPLTIVITRRRSDGQGSYSVVAVGPRYRGPTMTYDVAYAGVRWRCHVPLMSDAGVVNRQLDLIEIRDLEVERPPRCPRDGCGAELAESPRRWPLSGTRWGCLLDGSSYTSTRTTVAVAEEAGNVARGLLGKLRAEGKTSVQPQLCVHNYLRGSCPAGCI